MVFIFFFLAFIIVAVSNHNDKKVLYNFKTSSVDKYSIFYLAYIRSISEFGDIPVELKKGTE